jgi:hypothetical protein
MKKTNLDSLSPPDPNFNWLRLALPPIHRCGFRAKNLALAQAAVQAAAAEHPVSLRGLFYRLVSAGVLPSNDKKHYKRLGEVVTRLRESGALPFDWIVDNLRATIKPSSWPGLSDYVEAVERCYRLDYWQSLPTYVHVICEKDAIAGVLAPVTQRYDVALSPIRGYCSVSFAHEIADRWNSIDKPIHAYYLGDYDASGFDLERDVKAKLHRYCEKSFTWERLGVLEEDFDDFDLIPLAPKKTDRRHAAFVRVHGHQCAELDALPASELRLRVETAIEDHVPKEEWAKLQETERLQQQSFQRSVAILKQAS